MKRLLLVDDDLVVLRLYQAALSRHGFDVETAGDGLAGIQAVRTRKPDLMVLDLMMPKFTGVDVLSFLRSQSEFADLPVIVLSNSYMDELAQQAAKLGVQKALLKIRCSPPVLVGIINDILAGRSTSEDVSPLLAAPALNDPAPPTPGKTAPDPARAATPSLSAPSQSPAKAASEPQAQARRDFLDNARETRVAIRNLCQDFNHAHDDAERDLRLQSFYHKIHFVSASAGLAQCHQIALLASVFEALLFELIGKPAFITPSVLRTIAFAVDFLGVLFDRSRETTADVPLTAQVLAVDDDPSSNRLVVAALKRAQLQARSAENPVVALKWLHENQFDLVLLDIEMPGMDGYELCKQLRSIPGYRRTPVIYVTGHSDFESRARSVLSGGNDLIAKPVFPIELAVKAVTHLLKSRLD